MALVLLDRCQQTGSANTTVSFTLTGSVTGFQSFAGVGNTNTTYYSAFDTSGNWETGLGTYSTTGPILTRTTIYQSSNSNAAVTFVGTVNIFVTYPAGRNISLDASGNATALGTPVSGNLTNCTFPTLNQNTSGSAGSVTNALTISSPLTGTSYNGSSAVSIGIPVATTSVSGYITSTDWNTFNGKQAAGSYVTVNGALGTPSSGTLTNCTLPYSGLTGTVPTWNQNTTGSAATFTSTTQNSQFNSIGVGTAASTTAGEIRATNNVTAYYSDDNLKTKLGKIENALDKVCALEGFYYEANETAQMLGYEVKREVGLSAQSTQKEMPEIVAPAPISDKYLTIRYERYAPYFVEAIKELRKEIEELKRNK